MAANEKLRERVRELVAHAGKVQEKKMFRGVTFMVNKKMCVSVGPDRIMCRIDPEIHEIVVEKPGCRTVMMGGKAYRGFVHVDEEFLRTKKQLEYWVNLALEFNKNAKASKKKK